MYGMSPRSMAAAQAAFMRLPRPVQMLYNTQLGMMTEPQRQAWFQNWERLSDDQRNVLVDHYARNPTKVMEAFKGGPETQQQYMRESGLLPGGPAAGAPMAAPPGPGAMGGAMGGIPAATAGAGAGMAGRGMSWLRDMFSKLVGGSGGAPTVGASGMTQQQLNDLLGGGPAGGADTPGPGPAPGPAAAMPGAPFTGEPPANPLTPQQTLEALRGPAIQPKFQMWSGSGALIDPLIGQIDQRRVRDIASAPTFSIIQKFFSDFAARGWMKSEDVLALQAELNRMKADPKLAVQVDLLERAAEELGLPLKSKPSPGGPPVLGMDEAIKGALQLPPEMGADTSEYWKFGDKDLAQKMADWVKAQRARGAVDAPEATPRTRFGQAFSPNSRLEDQMPAAGAPGVVGPGGMSGRAPVLPPIVSKTPPQDFGEAVSMPEYRTSGVGGRKVSTYRPTPWKWPWLNEGDVDRLLDRIRNPGNPGYKADEDPVVRAIEKMTLPRTTYTIPGVVGNRPGDTVGKKTYEMSKQSEHLRAARELQPAYVKKTDALGDLAESLGRKPEPKVTKYGDYSSRAWRIPAADLYRETSKRGERSKKEAQLAALRLRTPNANLRRYRTPSGEIVVLPEWYPVPKDYELIESAGISKEV